MEGAEAITKVGDMAVVTKVGAEAITKVGAEAITKVVEEDMVVVAEAVTMIVADMEAAEEDTAAVAVEATTVVVSAIKLTGSPSRFFWADLSALSSNTILNFFVFYLFFIRILGPSS